MLGTRALCYRYFQRLSGLLYPQTKLQLSCDKMDDLPDLMHVSINDAIFDFSSSTDLPGLGSSSHYRKLNAKKGYSDDTMKKFWTIKDDTNAKHGEQNEIYKVEIVMDEDTTNQLASVPFPSTQSDFWGFQDIMPLQQETASVENVFSSAWPNPSISVSSLCEVLNTMWPNAAATLPHNYPVSIQIAAANVENVSSSSSSSSSACPSPSASSISSLCLNATTPVHNTAPNNSPATVHIPYKRQRVDIGIASHLNPNVVTKMEEQFGHGQGFDDGAAAASSAQLLAEKFRLLTIHNTHNKMVGCQAFFLLEAVSSEKGALLRNCLSQFKIELTLPNGSIQNLSLHSHPIITGAYSCSFYPTQTGTHVLSAFVNTASNSSSSFSISVQASAEFRHIKGSPIVINPCRNYKESVDRNFVQMGFNKNKSFCLKAWGIAVYRPKNLIYIADRENHEVLILDESPRILGKFGGKGSLPGQFIRPTGVAVDHVRKRVIISDKDNHRISIFDLKGNFIFNFGKRGHDNGDFNYPWGVAVPPNGEIIAVADSRNYRIQFFDVNGNFLRKYCVFETQPFLYKDEFNYPRGIAFSADGSQVYVTDFNIQIVFVFNLDLTRKDTFVQPKLLSRPQGIAVDEAGNVLIADSRNNCIRVATPEGNPICTLNRSGKEKFCQPLNIAVLRGGKVAVIDNNNRFRLF